MLKNNTYHWLDILMVINQYNGKTRNGNLNSLKLDEEIYVKILFNMEVFETIKNLKIVLNNLKGYL